MGNTVHSSAKPEYISERNKIVKRREALLHIEIPKHQKKIQDVEDKIERLRKSLNGPQFRIQVTYDEVERADKAIERLDILIAEAEAPHGQVSGSNTVHSSAKPE